MRIKSDLIPLIDGDIYLYRVGFATKDGEPLENALHSMKLSLENVYNKFKDAPSYKLYLTGKDNFRDKLATLKIYKGNRDPLNKPFYYNELKEYMIHVHGAIVINGQEADDAIGIEQYSAKDKSTCIVSIDKDLDSICGYHYHFVKDSFYYVTLADANYNFFKQMLVGDTTDNIPGIFKVGPKTADKLLAPCNKAVVDMQRVVKEQYVRQYKDQADAAYKEVANLLWIRREENQECPF